MMITFSYFPFTRSEPRMEKIAQQRRKQSSKKQEFKVLERSSFCEKKMKRIEKKIDFSLRVSGSVNDKMPYKWGHLYCTWIDFFERTKARLCSNGNFICELHTLENLQVSKFFTVGALPFSQIKVPDFNVPRKEDRIYITETWSQPSVHLFTHPVGHDKGRNYR